MIFNIWNDCPQIPLPELLDFIVDNRGKTVPTTESGHALIATNCIRNENLYPIYEKIRYLSDHTYNTWFRAHPQSGDILFVNKGTPGRVCMVPDPVNFCIAQDMIALRVDNDKIYNKYLFYVLRSDRIQKQIYNTNVGDVIPHFKKSFMDQLMIPIPKRQVQESIGDFYFQISSMIDLNKKINHNLAQQAQAIFKSWFVDFDPWDGVMPDNWRLVKLGSLCQSISKTHSFDKDMLIFLNTGDIVSGQFLHSNYFKVSTMPGQAKKSIKHGDILYSEIRPINRHFAYVGFDAPDYVVSTKLMVIRATDIDPRRLYHYLTSSNVITELQITAESRSGTFPQIRFENIQQFEILLATPEVERKFSSFLHDIYAIIDTNLAESARLAEIRNSLLPRLMSGEISVGNI